MALTKIDVIEAIRQRELFSPRQGYDVVEDLLEIMKSTMASGEDIMISGFGKFCVNEKAARKGRNPATDKEMMLPPRRMVTFKCSGQLRDRINR